MFLKIKLLVGLRLLFPELTHHIYYFRCSFHPIASDIQTFMPCSLQTGFSNPDFDDNFNQFLKDNGYRGGAVAAMKDGKLLLAKGYGTDRAGYEVGPTHL